MTGRLFLGAISISAAVGSLLLVGLAPLPAYPLPTNSVYGVMPQPAVEYGSLVLGALSAAAAGATVALGVTSRWLRIALATIVLAAVGACVVALQVEIWRETHQVFVQGPGCQALEVPGTS